MHSAESMTQFTGRKMTGSIGLWEGRKTVSKAKQCVTHGRNFFNMGKIVANPSDECVTALMKCNMDRAVHVTDAKRSVIPDVSGNRGNT